MATQPVPRRTLKVKLGGKVITGPGDRASDAQPSGETQQTTSTETVDAQAGAISPTAHALAILSKVGVAGLPEGRQLMPSLPPTWANLRQQLAGQPREGHSSKDLPNGQIPSRQVPNGQIPSRPLLNGQIPSRQLPDGQMSDRQKVSTAQAPDRQTGVVSAPPAKQTQAIEPHKQAALKDAATKTAAPAKGKATAAKGAPRQEKADANGQVRLSVKGTGDKGKADATGQPKPAWGAAQPAAGATNVAAARSYKRLRKSPSPPESQPAERPLPTKPDVTIPLPKQGKAKRPRLDDVVQGETSQAAKPQQAGQRQPAERPLPSKLDATAAHLDKAQAKSKRSPSNDAPKGEPPQAAKPQQREQHQPAERPLPTQPNINAAQPKQAKAKPASGDAAKGLRTEQSLPTKPDVAAAHSDKAQAKPKSPPSDDAVKVEASKAAQPKKAESDLPLNGASSSQGAGQHSQAGLPLSASAGGTTAATEPNRVSSAVVGTKAQAPAADHVAAKLQPNKAAKDSLSAAPPAAPSAAPAAAAEAIMAPVTNSGAAAEAFLAPVSDSGAAAVPSAATHTDAAQAQPAKPNAAVLQTTNPLYEAVQTADTGLKPVTQPIQAQAEVPITVSKPWAPAAVKPVAKEAASQASKFAPRVLRVNSGSKAVQPSAGTTMPTVTKSMAAATEAVSHAAAPEAQQANPSAQPAVPMDIDLPSDNRLKSSIDAGQGQNAQLMGKADAAEPNSIGSLPVQSQGIQLGDAADSSAPQAGKAAEPIAVASGKQPDGIAAAPGTRAEAAAAAESQGRAEGKAAMAVEQPDAAKAVSPVDGQGQIAGSDSVPARSKSGDQGKPRGSRTASEQDMPRVARGASSQAVSQDRGRGRSRRSRSPRGRQTSRPSSRRASTSHSSSSRSSSSRSRSRSYARQRSRSREPSRPQSQSYRSRTGSRDRRGHDRENTRDNDRGRAGSRQPYNSRGSRQEPRDVRKDSRSGQNDRTRDRDSRRSRDRGSRRSPERRDRAARGSKRSPERRDRDHKQTPQDPAQNKGRASSKQPSVEEQKDYPVNDQGIVVSPENMARARDRRQIRNVEGQWVKPEDSGLLGSVPSQDKLKQEASAPVSTPAASSAETTAAVGPTKEQARAAATATAPKATARNAPLISPYALPNRKFPSPPASATAPKPQEKLSAVPSATATEPVAKLPPPTGVAATAGARKVPLSSQAGVVAVSPPLPSPVAPAAAAAAQPLTLAPISSAKPADPPQPTAATAGTPVTTAALSVPMSTASPPAAENGDAQSPADAEQPTVDIYSPIRAPPAAAPTPASLPPMASLPTPQLNPLPPNPQQPPGHATAAAQYATADQVAAWQQHQAYQGYYGAAYPYADPNAALAYSQTQPYAMPVYSMGVPGPQPPPGVPPPRPPPLGPNSPPPRGPAAAKLPSAKPTAALNLNPSPPAADSAPPASSAMPSNHAPAVAGVPLSSSNSIGRAGQNGARAGLEQPQGSSVRPGQKGLRADPAQPQDRLKQPLAPSRQRSASPEAERRRKVQQHDRLSPEAERRRKAHERENRSLSPEAERRRKAHQQNSRSLSPEAVRRRKEHAENSRSLSPEAERRRKAHEKANRSGRDSARSDNSSEAVPGQNRNSPRALAPSRLGPGREMNTQMAATQDAARPSKKRTQRDVGGGSGSQGSRHSPAAGSESPAKRLKTAPSGQPLQPGPESNQPQPQRAPHSNPNQAQMLAESPTYLATQAEQLMQQALACGRDASHAPVAQAVQLAIQACTVYMHQAAVLREKNLSVHVRLLECLRAAVQSCEQTLRMHKEACSSPDNSSKNPLHALGLTVLMQSMLSAASLQYAEAERNLVHSAKSHLKLSWQAGVHFPTGSSQGSAAGVLQRLNGSSSGSSKSVPSHYLQQDQQLALQYMERMLQYTELKGEMRRNSDKLTILANNVRNGSVAVRSEVQASFHAVYASESHGKAVDYVYSCQRAMEALKWLVA